MLQQRYADLLDRLAAACSEHGRAPSDVQLLAVSKLMPASAVAELHNLGQLHFGENYVQEAEEKAAALAHPDDPRDGSGYSAADASSPGSAPGPIPIEKRLEIEGGPTVPEPAEKARARAERKPLQWHLIGPLQRNKAKTAAELFGYIHSVDRLELADRLDAVATAPVRGFVQVRLGGEDTKAGLDPDRLLEELARWSERRWQHLQLVGLMTVPPPGPARAHFARLRELRDRVRREGWPMFADYDLSMGMSDDFPDAVAEGSNWVRVGRALFGERPAH